jgi:hypothetical protein
MQVSLPKDLIRRRRVNRPWVAFAQAVLLANAWLFFKVATDAMAGGFVGAMIGAVFSLFVGRLAELVVFLGFVCGLVLGGVSGLVNGFRVLVKDASEELKKTDLE